MKLTKGLALFIGVAAASSMLEAASSGVKTLEQRADQKPKVQRVACVGFSFSMCGPACSPCGPYNSFYDPYCYSYPYATCPPPYYYPYYARYYYYPYAPRYHSYYHRWHRW